MVRIIPRLGCIGSFIFAVVLLLACMAVLAPRAFHMGGHWTPNMTWQGIGTMRDSTGRQYGLYASFYPYMRYGRRSSMIHVGPATPTPRYPLRGQASLCTQQGIRIPFDVGGDIYGVWLDAESKQIDLSLSERTDGKRKRRFSVHGSFQGPSLPMDDHKSMFMYLPDGKLTPAVVHQPGT
jgi:hypothetical protein